MTFVIAEIGLAHSGDVEVAKRLVDASKEAGSDAVKFQTFHNIGRLEEYELTDEEFIELKHYCDKKKTLFLSTPHSIEAIDFVDSLVPMHKVASPFLDDEAFLKRIVEKGKPVLLSTGSLVSEDGMASMGEVILALNAMRSLDVTLMHCVSKYPCKHPHYNRIRHLEWLGVPVGLSDHSKTIVVPRGLPVIEKHIMLEDMDCVDKDVSLTPKEFKEMTEWLKYS